jgi:hypothetical protein
VDLMKEAAAIIGICSGEETSFSAALPRPIRQAPGATGIFLFGKARLL